MKGRLNDIKDLHQLAEKFYISGEFKIMNYCTVVPDVLNCSDFYSHEIITLKPEQLPVNMSFDAGVMIRYRYKYHHKYRCKNKGRKKYSKLYNDEVKSTFKFITLHFNVYSGIKEIDDISVSGEFERHYICEPFVKNEVNKHFLDGCYEIYKEDIEVKILD